MMRKMQYGLCAVMVLLLSACAHKPPAPKPTLAQIRRCYIQQLKKEGVQTIQLGQTLRFVLFSKKLFHPDSANIRSPYRPVLKTLAKLMHTYEKVNVKVAGYTDNRGRIRRQQALTTRQAQVVASFLWSKKIDARLVYAVGFNRRNAVAWNGNAKGRCYNRRVEVSFRYYE